MNRKKGIIKMTIDDIIKNLRENENPSRKKSLIKAGAPQNTYGVLLGYLRKLAKTIGTNQKLALALWETQNTDARLLAVMLFDPKLLDKDKVYALLSDVTFDQLLDDFMFRLGIHIEDVDALYLKFINDPSDMLKRAAWTINVEWVKQKRLDINEIEYLLKVIEKELIVSDVNTQWMMNRCFAQIGITYEVFRLKVLKLAKTLGVYKDMKVAPGCTSAYVPSWIKAVVK